MEAPDEAEEATIAVARAAVTPAGNDDPAVDDDPAGGDPVGGDPAGGDPAGDDTVGVEDATVVVAKGAVFDDATIAVRVAEMPPPGQDPDATIVVPQRAQERTPQRVPERLPGAAHADPGAASSSGAAVGAPVVEQEEIPPELAKLLFKNPLDTKRRAPAAPFPSEHASLPRGGVRGGMPVVYGARGEGFTQGAQGTDLGRALGPPPAGYAIPTAQRDLLPSLARLNRRFSVLAWAGALVVPVVTGLGLWWVLTALLRQ